MNIRDEIKLLRKETGLNRKQFAEHFEIPLRTLEEWEAGRRRPPEYVIRMLTYYVKATLLTAGDCINNSVVREDNSFCGNERHIDVVTDFDGRKVVVIHDILFRNKQNISWADVEAYVRMYVGEIYMIDEDSNEIYIGRDLPDEYANSKYTRSLRGGLAKAKANVAQAIPKLIEISEHGKFQENKNKKHDIDAKGGWYVSFKKEVKT